MLEAHYSIDYRHARVQFWCWRMCYPTCKHSPSGSTYPLYSMLYTVPPCSLLLQGEGFPSPSVAPGDAMPTGAGACVACP